MTEAAIYQAILDTEKETVYLEYLPLENGAIEIVSFSVSVKVVSDWEQRVQSRRKAGRKYLQPQLMDEEILSQNPLPPAPERL